MEKSHCLTPLVTLLCPQQGGTQQMVLRETHSHRAWTVWAGLVSPLPGDSFITDVFVPDSVLGDKNEMLSRLMCRCCP